MITVEQLLAIMPECRAPRAELFIDPLNDAMAKFDINSKPRAAAFLAQAAHESDQLRALTENLNYAADVLVRQWPKRFTPELAAEVARQPERIANIAYANRLGNGPPESGDGWYFRGRGIFQLTGRENYEKCSAAIYGDDRLIAEPDLLERPDGACKSAGWYWQRNGLNVLADAGKFKEITVAINGGTNGLDKRTAFLFRADEALR